VQLPTVRNAVLKYGSWLGFFEQHSLDILCLQVGECVGGAPCQPGGSSGMPGCWL
jgi:hypothetical protein